MNLPLLLFIAFGSAAVATITGFGAAIILTPFLSLLIDLKSAIVLVAIFHIAIAIVRIILLRKGVVWKILFLYGIPSLLTAGVASWIFKFLHVTSLTWGVAIFLILFALYSLFVPNLRVPEKDSLLVLGGLIGGFVSGLIGMAGGIRSAFLVSTELKKESFIATSTAIALATDVIRILIYYFGGSMKDLSLPLIPSLLFVGILGTFAGKWLLGRLNEDMAQKAVLFALLLLGIKMIYDLVSK